MMTNDKRITYDGLAQLKGVHRPPKFTSYKRRCHRCDEMFTADTRKSRICWRCKKPPHNKVVELLDCDIIK